MTNQHFRPFRNHVQDEELEEGRADHEEYCVINELTVLVLDQVCLCRQRNIRCRMCIYDSDRLQAQLLWMLLDLVEDREVDEVRRLSMK